MLPFSSELLPLFNSVSAVRRVVLYDENKRLEQIAAVNTSSHILLTLRYQKLDVRRAIRERTVRYERVEV